MAQGMKKESTDRGARIVISLDDLTNELSQEVMDEEEMLELQLTMATTSINHEYAKLEYDESPDYERKEELLAYMTECRGKYLEAREQLENYNPLALENFERDLVLQKLATITHYNA